MIASRWGAAAVASACGLLVYSLLPPGPIAPAPHSSGIVAPVRGVIHIHTRRSDGTGTLDEVAAAASRAGLQFVIVTDHGDGTRQPEAPAYRSGVLSIEAVEVSTDEGHLVALDTAPTPYPLGGQARDVLEDLRRLGGFSVAAHPDSARQELRWTADDHDYDGLEWLNGDSQWRDEGWFDLGRALLTYPFGRAATLTTLLDRPDAVLEHWDSLTAQRSVVALAASDAHARLGVAGDSYSGRLSLRVPSYEQVFRTFSISLPGIRLTGAAGTDARIVLDAIRRGQVYSSIEGLASPAHLAFSAVSGSSRATMGERLAVMGPVEFRAESNLPRGARLLLLHNGEEIASSPASPLVHTAQAAAGAYRVEIRLEDTRRAAVPWVLSNPIYVGSEARSSPPASGTPASETVMVYADGPAADWRLEKNRASEGSIDVVASVGGTQLSLRYGLGGLLSEGPYVAAVVPVGGETAGFDRLTFTARAARPMRVSVQLRAPGGDQGRRWRRSVFLDESARTATVRLADMIPVGSTSGAPVLAEVRDLLVVVDTVNTEPGSNGQIWLDDVRFER